MDPDGDPFVYELVPPSGTSLPFRIAFDGTITVDGVLDYEWQPLYTLVVAANETSASRDCVLSSSALIAIVVTDVPEPPYFKTLPPTAIAIPEEEVYPYNTSTTVAVMVADYTSANTSAVVVTVAEVTARVDMDGVLYSTVANGSYFDVVDADSGGPCLGGVVCTLRVAATAARMDYDTGLRSLMVVLQATGATGLTATASLLVNITNVNERTCHCVLFDGNGGRARMCGWVETVAGRWWCVVGYPRVAVTTVRVFVYLCRCVLFGQLHGSRRRPRRSVFVKTRTYHFVVPWDLGF